MQIAANLNSHLKYKFNHKNYGTILRLILKKNCNSQGLLRSQLKKLVFIN
jgi:hypothetical protein